MSLQEVHDIVVTSFDMANESSALFDSARNLVESARDDFLIAFHGTGQSEFQESANKFEMYAADIGVLALKMSKVPDSIYTYLEHLHLTLPTLDTLVADNTNSAIIRTINPKTGEDEAVTEQEAVKELTTFLDNYRTNGTDPKLRQEADSMRNTLNIVTKQSLEAACKDIAEDWQDFLERDPENMIVVAPGVSSLANQIKSDALVTERVLQGVSESVGSRIISDIKNVNVPPSKVRVIALDDWSLSGGQLSSTIGRFVAEHVGSPYLSKLEVNLVLATPEMLREGFKPRLSSEGMSLPALPVKAARVARVRQTQETDRKYPALMHATGTHSATDHAFGVIIYEMVKSINNQRSLNQKVALPTLARYDVRAYTEQVLTLWNKLIGR